VHFGLFLDSDLLVLRDFFVREEDFWPLFRPLLGRTFEHDLPRLGPPGARWLTGHCCRLASSRWLALVSYPSLTSTRAVNCSTQLTLLVLYVAGFSVRDKLHFADFHSGFSARSSVDLRSFLHLDSAFCLRGAPPSVFLAKSSSADFSHQGVARVKRSAS
jgi:hypothetical protein